MTTPSPRTIALRPGLDLDLREAGTAGSPVLVLHGGPGPAGSTPLIDHLAPDHRVLAPTHPGWDGTTRPDELDSVPALASAYLDLLCHLGLHDVTVIGTSFGGWVATQAALDDREGRISKLVVIDAIGPVVPGQQVTVPNRPPAGAPRGGPPAQAMATMRTYAGPAMGDPGLLPRLSAVTCPVLVIWGADDTIVTPEFGRAYAAAFPHARFELIPGAGHVPVQEKPEAVFAVLDSFLTCAGSAPTTGAS
jgi:pimeloyl-ACP methyl ester carboxylesterase